MFDVIIMMLVTLLGFDNKPKHSLHKKEDTFKLNDTVIIYMIIVFGVIFFFGVFFLIGHCTDSGVFYNSNLY